MPDEVTPERVTTIAAAARVPLAPESPPRIARATTPTVTRFAVENLALELETEPAMFVAMQRKDAGL
jgi:hypothetical protein